MGFKLIRQRDSMQCGVASLAMICKHYGKVYSTKYIEQYCHPSNEGISLKGLIDGSKELGFIPTAIKNQCSRSVPMSASSDTALGSETFRGLV